MDLSCLTGDRDRDLGGKDGEKDLRESKSKRMSKSNRTLKDVEAKVQCRQSELYSRCREGVQME